MPIISRIGRRSLKVRMLILTIYALLIGGAVTMVYPFLLMIAGSTKSAVDESDARVVPRFLTSEEVLWGKHVEGLFNESLDMMRQVHDSEASSFKTVAPPAAVNEAMVDAWRAFLGGAELPNYFCAVGYIYAPRSRGVVPGGLRRFKDEMSRRYGGDIRRLNRALGVDFSNWQTFLARPESYLERREKPGPTGFDEALREFKARQPLADRYYFSPEGFFRHGFIRNLYSRRIGTYNRTHGTTHASYGQVHLSRRAPPLGRLTEAERADVETLLKAGGELLGLRLPAGRDGRPPVRWGRLIGAVGRVLGERRRRDDWEEFVRTILSLFWIRADAEAAPAYRRFLRAKYGTIDALNRNYRTRHASFEEVPLIAEPPKEGLALSDWDAFLAGWKDPDTGRMHILPIDAISIHSVDFLFRDHLQQRFGTIGRLNAAMGTSHADWMDVLPPQRELHYLAFRSRTGELRREFVVRNYLTVFDFMVRRGRGILNTAIYCTLAVLGALLVNPLAAYALSRYKPPSAYKVLLFLMLTMAFPPMVAQIPVFLMLRDLKLLNTFWALILPGLANGYSIFLLKGFFDSQPKELYESAELDGAGEFRIFWQITMSLSKPILAVIALGAFTRAYSNFMFALLICQDKKMWTLMVWLYQLQQNSGPGVVFASLILAALPVFVMFALCQNIIMRGIVVPVEK